MEQGYGNVDGLMIRKYDYVPTGRLIFSVYFGGGAADSDKDVYLNAVLYV